MVARRKAFGKIEKEQIVRLMRRYEKFCGVRILTYVVMSNHFHLEVEVRHLVQRARVWWVKAQDFMDSFGMCHGIVRLASLINQCGAGTGTPAPFRPRGP